MEVLGTFFWYSIPPKMVSLERVRRAWRSAGLNTRYLPDSRKPADVAAEACSSVGRRTGAPSFTQIENTSESLTYNVERLGEITPLIFDKATGEFSCFDDSLLRQVRGVYEQNSSRLPAHKQRQALRTCLLAGGAENLHGSIYFMPANGVASDRTDGVVTLDRAMQMVFGLHGEQAEFHKVPVERTPLQVAYVSKAIDRLLTDEIELLVSEVRLMIGDESEPTRKWRSDRIETIVQRKRALEVRGDRFAELLGAPPEKTFTAATTMDHVVTELVASVEAPVIA